MVDRSSGLQSAILLPLPVILQPDQSVTPPSGLIRALTPGDHGRSYAGGLADRTPARAAPAAAGIRIVSDHHLLDYFFRREPIEFFAAHPEQVAEHFARVLPQERRRQLVIDRRFRESHRAGDRRAGHARRVRDFDFQSAVPHLRVFEYFLVVVDRAAWHAGRLELREPAPAGTLPEDFVQRRNESGSVRDAARHGGVT